MLCLPLRIFAEEAANTENLRVTVHADYYNQGAEGGELSLYYVGTYDQDGTISPAGSFEAYTSFLSFSFSDSEEARELAQTLAAYVEFFGTAPDRSMFPNNDGDCVFEELRAGVWLLTGSVCTCDGKQYIPEPTLLLLPSQNSNEAEIVLKYDEKPINEETVTIQVIKVWETGDNSELRPDQITVVLLENGQEVETVYLRADTGWRHSWTGLSSTSVWTVIERDIPSGYSVRVTKEGKTFMIVNTLKTQPPDKPVDPKLPDTGMLIWPIPVLLSAGLLLLSIALVLRIRRKNGQNALD